MLSLENPLLKLYINIIAWALLGFIFGRNLPKDFSSKLGKFLYWIGIPVSIVAFMRKTSLSGDILVAPLTAWIAIFVGAGFAWIWIELGISDEKIKSLSSGAQLSDGAPHSPHLVNTEAIDKSSDWSSPTQGSFILAMMVGNTAYLGFPVVLSLVGPDYFVWAVLYNTLGTTLGVHGLGFALANRFGEGGHRQKNLFQVMLRNPALWSFGAGAILQKLPLPSLAEQGLSTSAWGVVTLSLFMIGVQLSQLHSLRKLGQTSTCLIIKMLLVPLVVGTGLMFFGITGEARLAIVLQMAMPPSFATVLYSEAYKLDTDLTVTSVAFGSVALLFTLPIWLWLFGT